MQLNFLMKKIVILILLGLQINLLTTALYHPMNLIYVNYQEEKLIVIPDKNNIYFLVEVLSSPPIYIGNDNFTDWLDRFNDWVLDEYKFIENVILEKCDLI